LSEVRRSGDKKHLEAVFLNTARVFFIEELGIRQIMTFYYFLKYSIKTNIKTNNPTIKLFQTNTSISEKPKTHGDPTHQTAKIPEKIKPHFI